MRRKRSVCVRMLMKRGSVVTLMQFLSRSLHSLCPALDNELANPFPVPPPTGPTCYAQRILSAIFGAPLLIYFPDLVMIIIIVAWGAIFKLTAIPPVLSAWHHPACRGVPAPPLPVPLPRSSWKQYKEQWSGTDWYVSLLSLFKSGVWKLTLFAL